MIFSFVSMFSGISDKDADCVVPSVGQGDDADVTPPVMPFMTTDAGLVMYAPAGRPAGRRFARFLCLTKETAETRSSFRKGFFSVEFFQQQRRCLRRCPF